MAGYNTLDQVNRIINISTFSMSVLLQITFLIRFRFKADKAALGILFTYLIVNGFRILVPKTLYSNLDRWITPSSTSTIYSLLFFFVFEMSYIRAFLNTASASDYIKEKRRITRLRAICIGAILLIYWPTSLYLITNWKVEDSFGYVMIVLRALSMLLSSVYCFSLCLSNLKFFIKHKYS